MLDSCWTHELIRMFMSILGPCWRHPGRLLIGNDMGTMTRLHAQIACGSFRKMCSLLNHWDSCMVNMKRKHQLRRSILYDSGDGWARSARGKDCHESQSILEWREKKDSLLTQLGSTGSMIILRSCSKPGAWKHPANKAARKPAMPDKAHQDFRSRSNWFNSEMKSLKIHHPKFHTISVPL